MKIKDQVVSLELAKELKGLGVKQDSAIYWIYYTRESLSERDWKQLSRKEFNMEEFEWGLDHNLCKRTDYVDRCSAYTVAELGEMLPGEISEKIGNMTANRYFLDCGKIDSEHSYYVRYTRHATGGTFCIMHGSIEADPRAKMLICLIKEGIVKAEDKK